MTVASLRKAVSQLVFHDSGAPNQSLLSEAAINALILANIAVEIYYSYLGVETPYALRYFVFGSGVIFAAEVLIRIWTCVELDGYRGGQLGRLFYVLSPLAILDFAAVLPIILSGGAINTSFFRIFRIFELGNYISARDVSPVTLVKKSITKRIPEITIVVAILMSLIVFSAFLFNLVEGPGDGSAGALYRALPSIELIVQMLAGSDALNTEAMSDLGITILNTTRVMGLFLIGLPSAFVTGSFVAELQGVNELKRLRGVEGSLIRSIDVVNPIAVREYCAREGLAVRARERTLDDLQYRMDIAVDDVKKIASAFKTIKVRSIKDPSSGSSRISIEHLAVNRTYGSFKYRRGARLMIATQNPGEPGLNHFTETLAINCDSSLIANQLFSSGALRSELRQNFVKADYYSDRRAPAPQELKEFVGDIEGIVAERPQVELIYVSAISDRHAENFWVRQVNFNAQKVEEVAAQHQGMLLKPWSEADGTILAAMEALEPRRILKIAVSTRILRTEDPQVYFENLVIVRDFMRSILD